MNQNLENIQTVWLFICIQHGIKIWNENVQYTMNTVDPSCKASNNVVYDYEWKHYNFIILKKHNEKGIHMFSSKKLYVHGTQMTGFN